jgi:opacity protein-like surface antigen
MKKIFNFRSLIMILILCLTNTFHLFAQDKEKTAKEAEYGIKAGINFAELWGNDALPESDRKVGYSFGLYASYKVSRHLKLQPEVIWSLQGEASEKSGRYKISYINIPVMLKWSEGKFYYELGPQLGLLTVNTAKSVPAELKLDNFESIDFSLNAGLGYKLAEDWAIGIRYCQGLTNIVKGRDLKNNVFYIGLSYKVF